MGTHDAAAVTDGTNSLPMLRHIILRDDKSSTYKLGLLRVLCRVADGSAGLAIGTEEEYISLPLGLVALNWLRLYLPLLKANLPQSPINIQGGERLSFVKKSTRDLMTRAVPHLDLRVGHRFSRETGGVLHAALCSAADTIAKMPANRMTRVDGAPIFPVIRKNAPALKAPYVLDAAYLAAFGIMQVPRDLWRAFQRLAVWIEPALIDEWKRLIRSYATKPGRSPLDEAGMVAAMTWADPARDRSEPRAVASQLLASGHEVRCVWSNRPLKPLTLDIDHCFPWAAWPCSDLWNLLPTHRDINRNNKRGKLPSKDVLARARDAILSWWTAAYEAESVTALAVRFGQEARASLPGLKNTTERLDLHDLFEALELQRLRLLQDQQVPEWAGF